MRQRTAGGLRAVTAGRRAARKPPGLGENQPLASGTTPLNWLHAAKRARSSERQAATATSTPTATFPREEHEATGGCAPRHAWQWNVIGWVNGGRRLRPLPPPAHQAASLPAAAVAEAAARAAAVEAAAALQAWEDEERSIQELAFEEEEEELEAAQRGGLRTLKLLAAGGAAGAVSRSATAPIDRLKMLLQVHDGKHKMTIREGVQRMAAEGSIKSFFKGNGTNVVKIAPETAIKLTMNDVYKRLIAEDPEEITPPQRMVAGAMAGATAQAVIYPLELVRTRLAVCPTGTYAGIGDCARKVLAQEGWRAFYRGMLPSMLGILPYAGVDITTFELLKERLLEEYDGRPPGHMILAAGMLSSSIAQFSAYPLALVRTRLQAQGIGGQAVKYHGMVDVLVTTYRNEGFLGLYKGSLTNLAKLAPAAGISWFVFEEVKAALGVEGMRRPPPAKP